jgi:hypothetical protein
VLQGKGDRAGVLDSLFHKKEGNDTIRRDPCTSLGGDVIC